MLALVLLLLLGAPTSPLLHCCGIADTRSLQPGLKAQLLQGGALFGAHIRSQPMTWPGRPTAVGPAAGWGGRIELFIQTTGGDPHTAIES